MRKMWRRIRICDLDPDAGYYKDSQAVARIADRTSSQHLWGSRDVIGHVTIYSP